MKRSLLLVVLSLSALGAFSFQQDSVAVSDSIPAATGKHKSGVLLTKLNKVNTFMEWYMRYFPVPYGAYSKETNVLMGLTKYNAFTARDKKRKDSLTQASSISAFAYYTLNTQYKLVLESNIMLPHNKAIWKTDLLYVHYPLHYYGTGNETDLKNENMINTANVEFTSYYLFKVWKEWYVGPAIDLVKYNKVEIVPGSDVNQSGVAVPEALGWQSGLGLRISREKRDNRLNAQKGTYLDAGFLSYHDKIGSDFNYSYFQLDFRYYHTFWQKITLALQLRTESKNGNVPIQTLSLLGGDNYMRGSYIGRYRDNVALDSQAEIRFPIYWQISGVVFTGLGQVAPRYDAVKLKDLHNTYGMGLRFMVDTKHRVNLRFDMGFSKDQSIFIMNFSEAF